MSMSVMQDIFQQQVSKWAKWVNKQTWTKPRQEKPFVEQKAKQIWIPVISETIQCGLWSLNTWNMCFEENEKKQKQVDLQHIITQSSVHKPDILFWREWSRPALACFILYAKSFYCSLSVLVHEKMGSQQKQLVKSHEHGLQFFWNVILKKLCWHL